MKTIYSLDIAIVYIYDKTMQLYEFQINAANFIIDRLKRMLPVIDCSVVGAGKTFIALHSLKQVNKKFIIICPKIVITHWRLHIEEANLTHLCMEVVNYERIKFGNTYFFSKEGKWTLPDDSQIVVVFDEAHKLKGSNTYNSKLLTTIPLHIATPYLISATIADSPIAFANVAKAFRICMNEYKFIASFGYSKPYKKMGWVFDRNPQHLIRLHNIIFNEPSHPGVRITYNQITILTKTNTIKLLPIKDKFNRIQRLYDLIESLFANNTDNQDTAAAMQPQKRPVHAIDYTEIKSRRTQDEHFYELMSQAEDALNSFDAKILDEIEHTINVDYEEFPLVRRTRLKQFIELIKAKLIIPTIIEEYNNNMSIVVMLNYSWSIKLLYSSLRQLNIHDVKTITGSSKNRDETIADFQSNKLRIVILNTKAAGVGISLHDTNGVHNRVAYISPSDNIYELQQALGRIYRATSKSDARQYLISVVDSIEIAVYENYMNKLNMMSKILSGNDYYDTVN